MTVPRFEDIPATAIEPETRVPAFEDIPAQTAVPLADTWDYVLLQGGKISDLVPFTERQAYERIMADVKDREGFENQLTSTLYMASLLEDMDTDVIWDGQLQYSREIFGKELPPSQVVSLAMKNEKLIERWRNAWSGLVSSQEYTDEPPSWWDDMVNQAAKGLAMAGSGLAGSFGKIVEMEPPPGSWTYETPAIKRRREAHGKKLQEDSRFLWQLQHDPELALHRDDMLNKVLGMGFETIPYITATTAATILAGPLGGFGVGWMVEGNAAYQTAIDDGIDPELAAQIGMGVGVASGAIEAFGGRYADKLLAGATKKIKNKIMRGGAQLTIGSITEALEEAGQEVSAIVGEEVYRDVSWDEAVRRTVVAAGGGFAVGGLFKTAGAAVRGVTADSSQAQQMRALRVLAAQGNLTEQVVKDLEESLKEQTEAAEAATKPPKEAEATITPAEGKTPEIEAEAPAKPVGGKGEIEAEKAQGTGRGEVAEPVTDKSGVEIADIQGNPVEINDDGTITLYHRTTKEKAKQIRESGAFTSEEQNKVFFSNKPTGQAEGYGDEVIELRVNPTETEMEDAFSEGEVHLSLQTEQAQKALAQKPPAQPAPAKPVGGKEPPISQAGGIATEKVSPNLYIGNVTPGMKARIAKSGEFQAEDIHGFKEGGFPTKRTKIEMKRAEAGNYLTWAITAIDNIVQEVEETGAMQMTNHQIAMTQALVGDIKALQDALGYTVKPAQIVIRRAQKLREKLAGEVLERIPPELIGQVSDVLDLTTREGVKQFVHPTEKVTKTTYEIFKEMSKESYRSYVKGGEAVVKQHKNLVRFAREKLEKADVTPGERNKLLFAVARAQSIKDQVEAMAAVQATADKARKRHAAKRVKKPTPMSVDLAYREAIEDIKASIDPAFRKEKTLMARERTQKFFEEHPEKDIPLRVRKTLGKKSLSEMTVEEVEQAADAIEALEKQGKLKRKLKLAQQSRRFEEKKAAMISAISKGEPIEVESGPIVHSTTREGLVKTAAVKSRAWTLRPARIFDLLDGRKNYTGPNHRFFINRTNELTDKKWRKTDARVNPGKAKQEELGIDAHSLNATRVVNDVRYTVDEMIDIYAKEKNVASKLALVKDNDISEDEIAAIINELSDNEKAWGDYIISDYDANYNRLRNAVIEVENRDPGRQENYTPIRRTDLDYSTYTEEIIDAIMQRENLRKAYAEKGFTLKRVGGTTPIRLGITKMWLEQVAKQEQYINLAQHIRDMHRITDSADFKLIVKQKFGTEYNKVIKGYVNRVANPNIYRGFNSLENMSRRLRQNAAIAYLAYNLVTMAKQIPSVVLYLPDAGMTHLLTSAAEFSVSPLKMIQKVRDLDPQVKHKAIERELEELQKAGGNVVTQVTKKFGRFGMEGIYMMDAVARTIGWNAVYQKALADGKSEAEAVRAAQDATLRTQPAAAAKDLPELYATSEFANWFTMFTNQLNQIYNIATYDIPSYIKNAQYARAGLGTMGLGISALVIWMLSHRKVPEKPEELLEAGEEQAINAIPLVGKAIMAGKKGWDTDLPAFEGSKAVGRSIAAIKRGEFTDYDMKVVAEALAVTLGVPYIGPKRALEAVKTGEASRLLGGVQKKGKKTSRYKEREQ